MYALAASRVGEAAAILASEGTKTKGPRAVFAVVLMFLLLCGGVWLLLQSNFGPKQAYLISGVAFFGCWFVLSVLWLTGVPGVPLRWIGLTDIPRSTPQYYGPQGKLPTWQVLDTPDERARDRIPEDRLEVATPDIKNQAVLT